MRTNRHHIVRLISGLKWSSGAAAVVVGILLAATVVQTRIHGPVVGSDFSGIYQLADRHPANQELRDEIRALDMLARKAYFTSMYQLRVGTIIFFVALALFLLLWNLQVAFFPRPPPRPGEKISWWERQTRSSGAAAAVSAAVVVIAVSWGLFQMYKTAAGVDAKRGAVIGIAEELDAVIDRDTYLRWWMIFRGPDGIGVATHTNAPTTFDGGTMENIKWKVEVPLEGFSSPVVYDDKIFLTGGTKTQRQVFCFDAIDGRLLWTYDVKVAGSDLEVPRVDSETGYAAPSVACDGNRVYAIFATGEMVALTLSGELVWSKNLGVPDNHYGHSSSLITYDGKVFVQFDQYDVGKIFAFDGRTGAVVWQADRQILSWASPILVNAGKRQELIVLDNEYATSYDPYTGKKLWAHDCLYGEVGPSAAFAGGMVFTANEHARGTGIDLSTLDDAGLPTVRWRWRGNLPNTASPVSADTLLFLAAASGVVTCLDNRTGEEFWVHDFDRGFYSSPIIVGENVFLFDRNGVMRVIAASPEFTLIASSSIGEPVTTTPAILDGYMIVRGDKYLYRIEDGRGAEAAR